MAYAVEEELFNYKTRVIESQEARAPTIPLTPMGAVCFAEFEALVVALGGARLFASGVDV